MLAFNQLDYQVEKLIGIFLGCLDAPKLPSSTKFAVRLKYLNMLTHKDGGRMTIPVRELKDINKERGDLAHAHFEETADRTAYILVDRERQEYDEARINSLIGRIHELGQRLYLAGLALALGPLPVT